MTGPLWLQSNAMQALLHRLVDRLDAAQKRDTRPGSLKLDRTTWPALYDAERASAKEELWEQVRQLAQWGWVAIAPSEARSPSGYDLAPRLQVTDAAAVRRVTGRPHREPTDQERWRDAVWQHLAAVAAVKNVVATFRIEVPGHAADEVVGQLNRLPSLAGQPLLLREVSARLFWGQSKQLDGREALVAALLGLAQCPFPESPVQLQVFLPPGGHDGVLFIENLASFEQALRLRPTAATGLALVYAAGFKGSAARLRTQAGCSLFYSSQGALDPGSRSGFESWLFGDGPGGTWFWGDLDWAGMRILRALRVSFPDLGAWQPGYSPLLASLLAGGGHALPTGERGGQQEIHATGCAWADEHLLPALRKTGMVADQEGVFSAAP